MSKDESIENIIKTLPEYNTKENIGLLLEGYDALARLDKEELVHGNLYYISCFAKDVASFKRGYYRLGFAIGFAVACVIATIFIKLF